jgi:hypothetical protein
VVGFAGGVVGGEVAGAGQSNSTTYG